MREEFPITYYPLTEEQARQAYQHLEEIEDANAKVWRNGYIVSGVALLNAGLAFWLFNNGSSWWWFNAFAMLLAGIVAVWTLRDAAYVTRKSSEIQDVLYATVERNGWFRG